MSVLRNTNVTGSCEGFVPGLTQPTANSTSDNAVSEQAGSAETSPQAAQVLSLSDIQQGLAQLAPQEVKQLLSQHFADELESLKDETHSFTMSRAEQEAQQQKQQLEEQHDALIREFEVRQADLTQAIDFWLEKVSEEASYTKTEAFSNELFIQLLFRAVTQVTAIEVADKQYISSLIKQLSDDYKQESVHRLFVSEYHHQQITSYLDQQDKVLPWDILIDADLVPGDYRLEFTKGSLEQDLEHSLSNLKESLLSLSVLEGEQ